MRLVRQYLHNRALSLVKLAFAHFTQALLVMEKIKACQLGPERLHVHLRIPVKLQGFRRKLDGRSGAKWTAVGAKLRVCWIMSLAVQFGSSFFAGFASILLSG